MFYVYILQSQKDHRLYMGYTQNLKERFKKHNLGLIRSTKARRPLKLIHYEAFLHQQDATAQEKYFKSGWGDRFIKKILKNYLKINKRFNPPKFPTLEKY